MFDLLTCNIASLPQDCSVIICGDMNARTGLLNDFIPEIKGSDGDLTNLCPVEKNTMQTIFTKGELKRSSKDTHRNPNEHCKQLIELCIGTGLLIMNGRVGQDKRYRGIYAG